MLRQPQKVLVAPGSRQGCATRRRGSGTAPLPVCCHPPPAQPAHMQAPESVRGSWSPEHDALRLSHLKVCRPVGLSAHLCRELVGMSMRTCRYRALVGAVCCSTLGSAMTRPSRHCRWNETNRSVPHRVTHCTDQQPASVRGSWNPERATMLMLEATVDERAPIETPRDAGLGNHALYSWQIPLL